MTNHGNKYCFKNDRYMTLNILLCFFIKFCGWVLLIMISINKIISFFSIWGLRLFCRRPIPLSKKNTQTASMYCSLWYSCKKSFVSNDTYATWLGEQFDNTVTTAQSVFREFLTTTALTSKSDPYLIAMNRNFIKEWRVA